MVSVYAVILRILVRIGLGFGRVPLRLRGFWVLGCLHRKAAARVVKPLGTQEPVLIAVGLCPSILILCLFCF